MININSKLTDTSYNNIEARTKFCMNRSNILIKVFSVWVVYLPTNENYQFIGEVKIVHGYHLKR